MVDDPCFIELEDDTGVVGLDDDSGDVELEDGSCPQPPPPPTTLCFIELEDGTGTVELEDGTGEVELETLSCPQPAPPTVLCFIELEDGSGEIGLEIGSGVIELEDASCITGPPYVDPYPPLRQTSSCTIIPSYLYEQYFDDEDLQAFVAVYNQMAQQRASWFCEISLPIYTSRTITGALLDWVAEGLYGIKRPALPTGIVTSIGPLNTWALNTIVLNKSVTTGAINYFVTTDDIFKRIITWHFWKGDGFVFSVRWLKRRIMRFLTGVSGLAPNIDDTDQVSVRFELGNEVVITLTLESDGLFPLGTALIFQSAVASGAVELPFQFSFSVEIVNNTGSTGLGVFGGLLVLTDPTGYATSPTGLPPGYVWNDLLNVTVVPGVVPDPFAAPIYLGLITAAELLFLGGGNLPLSDPGVTNQLWNNGTHIAVSP